MMQTYQNIEFELSNNTGTLWLNRPEKHNALNPEMIREIIDCVAEVQKNEGLRVLIIRGKGPSFCAGADLNYMKGIAEFGYEENYQDSLVLAQCFNSIYTCNKATIAVVHGAAIGGANGILAACDYVLCDDDTKFAFSEVKLGIAPATISPYVIKRIGEYGARDLMITGRRFHGREAAQKGLANISLPSDQIPEHLNNYIRHLMTSGPQAIKACKKLIFNMCNRSTFEEDIDYTARLIAELRASDEGQEGMASFLEKRKPKWVE
jgi:methylglutaconyl-CoA hydratase